MRALVAFKKSPRKRFKKSVYMRFKDKQMMEAFIKRANRLGYDIKIFTHLGW